MTGLKKLVAISLAALSLAACNQEGGGGGGSGKAPETEEQKTLYTLGVQVARQIERFQLSPEELEYVKAGFSDQAAGKELKAKPEEHLQKVQELFRARQQAYQETVKKKAEAEKEKSKAFLEKAASETGAEKTPSGLVYKELTPGTGEMPKATDRVRVNYRGTLIDGTEFDNSAKKGGPVTFPLMGVIRCWTEGVQKMKVGGKSQLICPSDIAYGDGGSPQGNIPGGATLIFEVELLEILAAPTPPHGMMPMPTAGPDAGAPKK